MSIKEKISKRISDVFHGGSIEGKAVDYTFGEEGVELDNPDVTSPPFDTMLPDWPSYIALEVTNVCNLECTHCNYRYGVAHYTRDRGEMAYETADKVLSEASENSASVLMNYDGEPLMNKGYMSYLKLAETKGVKAYFNTNGMLFDKKFADELVEFFTGSVFFSVDGDKDWFQRVRVGGDYDKVISHLEYFLEVNEKAGWPIDVGVSLCNLGQSAEERKAFVDHWIDKVSFVSLGEVNDKDGSIISEPMTDFTVKKRPVCTVPWQTVGICHDGDVVPCSIYITRANTANAVLGNVHEKTIAEIWRDQPLTDFRKMLINRDLENTHCKTCERWRCQFTWPDLIDGNRRIERSGFWTTVYNTDRPLPSAKGG